MRLTRKSTRPALLSILLTSCLALASLSAQTEKKAMDWTVWGSWNKIDQVTIGSNGEWMIYKLVPGQGNSTLIAYNTKDQSEFRYPRVKKVALSYDGKTAAFIQTQDWEARKMMERKKVKEDAFPADTLVILSLNAQIEKRIPNVKSFDAPDKWGGFIAYQCVDPKDRKRKDLTLYLYDTKDDLTDSIAHVTQYTLADETPFLAAIVDAPDSMNQDGIVHYDTELHQQRTIFLGKGKYSQLVLHRLGRQGAVILDADSTKAAIRPYELVYWSGTLANPTVVHSGTDVPESNDLPLVSADYKPRFSDDGTKLFFGTRQEPILQDTAILDDEVVNVEVWSYNEGKLYTQQEVDLDDEKKRSYLAMVDLLTGKVVQVADLEAPEARLNATANGRYAVLMDANPYAELVSWEGEEYKDIYLRDLTTGLLQPVAKKVAGYPQLSPGGQFITWYNGPDSAWFSYHITAQKLTAITNHDSVLFYQEIHDEPSYPGSYGMAGWAKDDEALFVYDRYDLWQIDPRGRDKPIRLTHGREKEMRYRYVRMDPEEKFLPTLGPWWFETFDEATKHGGYARLDTWQPLSPMRSIIQDSFAFDGLRVAEKAPVYFFTKENFKTFPDIWMTTDWTHYQRISNANPQQSMYRWGDISLYHWYSDDGELLEGMLVKPEGFDPTKKYPMIVNFYEKSSDGLMQYRTVDPNRSQIVYPYYASNGYVIFNPNIPYKIGYPGESAFNAVMSGVAALLNSGFIDPDRVGVQGHSWGGYQIAQLITRTKLFRCAEAGAPVVNMFSAYGGIRWGSGMSREFQYEHTQSRIGGTIWEYPLRYFENSPLFFLDKIETPVLIMHNDNDSAVPWYQGIEFFTGLRRLNKPAWMLNYNGEPHWPTKWQNRVDFQHRMAQFFDHYLQDGPLPLWMQQGVPAIEKGINQGFEISAGGDQH